GALMSEPPAIFTLPAAVLAFLWATEPRPGPSPRPGPRVRRLLPGFLFGLTALIRPEYLLVGVAFAVLAALRLALRDGWRTGLVGGGALALAIALAIAPWAIRNQIVLDRTVPISTGGGKALYV